MAEARSAVSGLHVPPNLQEGRNTWRDFVLAYRKSFARQYYRTRNSIHNGMWPTSTSNLRAAVLLCFLWMMAQIQSQSGLGYQLWQLKISLHLPDSFPLWLQALIISWIVGIVFFVVLMFVRQYILRALLSYKGWLYERSISWSTYIWAVGVKVISGYHPSLYSCQKSLPRLPVPPLRQTLDKLLRSLEPVCSEEELVSLRTQAQEFEQTLGSKLQRILWLKSWWAPNYVSDWWEKYVYLMSRAALPINSNYYGMDHSHWLPTPRPCSRAATFAHCVLTFQRQVVREELPPLILRNTVPICMAQYERIFSTTRIPGVEFDELLHVPSSLSRHIAVYCKGIYYKVDIYDDKNQLLAPPALEQQFEWIVEDSQKWTENTPEAEKQLPALTTLPRTEWANIRSEFFQNGINKESLNIVETAILTVVLADAAPEDFSGRGKWLLHGDGSSVWYDKSVNLIIFQNGKCGINAEHSMADAPAVAHALEYAMTREVMEKMYTDDGKCMPLLSSFRQSKIKPPVRLLWEVEQPLTQHILQAKQLALKSNSDLDLVVREHEKWGKGAMKGWGVSPDAVVQMALQLAYFRDSGKHVQTYEASMTRLFLNGRTETIRSCTPEAANFVKVMESDVGVKEKIAVFKAACAQHQIISRQAMTGEGIDRHLFALYVCCQGLGYKSPFLETVLSRPWTLSTSQQPQQQQANVPDCNLPPFRNKVSPGGGFGPVSDSGYGVSYMLPANHTIFFHISSKHSCPDTNSQHFSDLLFQALEDIKLLFEASAVKST